MESALSPSSLSRALLLAILLLVPGRSDAQGPESGFRFAPESSYTVTLGYFVRHEENADLEDFMWDWRTTVGFAVLELDGKFLWLESRLGVRTGRQNEGLGVDPNYIDLGFGFIGEWRLEPASVWLGLDHASLHTIDKHLDWATSWWKILGAVGTPGIRPVYDPADVPLGGPGALERRFDWRVMASYWPEELPVIQDEASKGHPWRFDGVLALRTTVWRASRIGLQLHSHSGFERDKGQGTWREEELSGEWRSYQMLGTELSREGEGFAWSLSLDGVLADSRRSRVNREGLVRLAVGFYH